LGLPPGPVSLVKDGEGSAGLAKLTLYLLWQGTLPLTAEAAWSKIFNNTDADNTAVSVKRLVGQIPLMLP